MTVSNEYPFICPECNLVGWHDSYGEAMMAFAIHEREEHPNAGQRGAELRHPSSYRVIH